MSWRQIYYDDAASLKLRYDMINRKGLRGAGIWALGYDVDRPEMRQAIAEKFLNDKTVAPRRDPNIRPEARRAETFTVSWVGSDESGVVDYDVQVSIHGGPWHDWLIDTKATSATYTGADGYGFAFRVRARDTHGNSAALGRRERLSLPRRPRGRATSARSSPRASTSDPERARPTRSSRRPAAGTILVDHRWPGQRRRLHVVQGHACRSSSGRRSPACAPTSGSRPGSGSTTLVAAVASPEFDESSICLPASRPPAGARFVGIDPARFLDTRFGVGLTGPFASGSGRTFPVAGRRGVPSNAVAVTGTLTVVGQTSAGYASLGPSSGDRRPLIGREHTDRRCSGRPAWPSSSAQTDRWPRSGAEPGVRRPSLIFDVSGYFVAGASGATYVPLSPARVLDTRTGAGLSGPFTSGAPRYVRGQRPRRRPDRRRGGDRQPHRRRAYRAAATPTSGRSRPRRPPARASMSSGETPGPAR